MNLKFGTRGSKLALWQTRSVMSLVRDEALDLELVEVVIKTLGDRVTDQPLFKVGGQGLFIKEIEEALHDGRADLAVHSLKDVPHQLAEGMALAAISAREDPRDALLSRSGKHLAGLPAGSVIGTSSLRRRAQLKRMRPDLRYADLRGNLDTRLRKLDEGQVDAVVLAAAGLRRLGFADRITEWFDVETLIPAAGQGFLAVECRAADLDWIWPLLRRVEDPAARAAALAERAFLARLQGGCQVPLAVHAVPVPEGLRVRGFLADPDGGRALTATRAGSAGTAEALGFAVADDLLAKGALEVLESWRQAVAGGSEATRALSTPRTGAEDGAGAPRPRPPHDVASPAGPARPGPETGSRSAGRGASAAESNDGPCTQRNTPLSQPFPASPPDPLPSPPSPGSSPDASRHGSGSRPLLPDPGPEGPASPPDSLPSPPSPGSAPDASQRGSGSRPPVPGPGPEAAPFPPSRAGSVFLVGSGPGDPGLITVRGLELVRAAEVIVYDALGATSFLEFARPDAELINAGKRAGDHTLTQDEINATLVRKAREGKMVVRLKGGDPMVFGRGGEELEELGAAGIPFEVVPGVTSAIAGPCYAGIPVTHRDFTSEVAIVTGHDAEPGAAVPRDPVPWSSLAGLRTVVFLMGVRQLPHIVRHLVEAGKDPGTPVALVEQATTPRQRCVSGTLATIVEIAARAVIKPPAIIIVGKVVSLREKLAWFEKRPLSGRTIVVTRSRAQAGEFCRRLEELGAAVLPFPTIRIEKIRPNPDFAAFLGRLADYSHLVFASVNGAEAFWENLLESGRDARALAGKQIICIGPVTAAEFRRHGVVPDLVPDTYVAESLLPFFQRYPAGTGTGAGVGTGSGPVSSGGGMEGAVSSAASGADAHVRPRRVAILRAETARDLLPDTLTREGWPVDVIVLYRTVSETEAPPAALAALSEGRVDAVTFTSSSTVDGFLKLIEGQGLAVAGIPAVSIGPVTSDTVRRHGLRLLGTAPVHTIPGLVDHLLEVFRQ